MKYLISGLLNFNLKKPFKTLYYYLLFNFLLIIPVIPQSFPVRSYTVEDGLITNFVNDAIQDNHGRMWFATEVGVSMYDGFSWKNYTPKDNLPMADYYKIKLDENKYIWAIPYDIRDKIAFFNGKSWQFIIQPDSKYLLQNIINYADITSINNQLSICIGTNSGVYIYNQNS